MITIKLLLTAFLIGSCYAIKCFSGIQGSVNGDSIGKIELLDCNGTEFCVKFPSNGHVGRKHYEGAQYSCDFGECQREGCTKHDGRTTVCCCATDECNKSFPIFNQFLLVFISIISLFLASF